MAKEKIALTISAEVNGKTVKLELTENEVLTGSSICEKNSLKAITVMKKLNGGALFFMNSVNAANAQQRHSFDYSFEVEAKELKAEAIKIKASRKSSTNKKEG